MVYNMYMATVIDIKVTVSEFRADMRRFLNQAADGTKVVITRHDEEFLLAPLGTPRAKGSPSESQIREAVNTEIPGLHGASPAKSDAVLEDLPIAEPTVDRSDSQELEYCRHGNVVGYCPEGC